MMSALRQKPIDKASDGWNLANSGLGFNILSLALLIGGIAVNIEIGAGF